MAINNSKIGILPPLELIVTLDDIITLQKVITVMTDVSKHLNDEVKIHEEEYPELNKALSEGYEVKNIEVVTFQDHHYLCLVFKLSLPPQVNVF